MKKALIGLCLLTMPVVSHGALIKSNQAGNWGTASTWVGGVIPGNGDTVQIFHVVTATDTRIIGTSPAGGNIVMHLESTGVIHITSTGYLKVRGDVTYTALLANTMDAVVVDTAAIFEFDSSLAASPLSQHYAFYPDNNFGYRVFRATGTATGRPNILANASSGMGALKAGGFAYVGSYIFSYANLTNMQFESFFDDSGTKPLKWDVTFSTFVNCGVIANNGPGPDPQGTFKHENNYHTGTVGGQIFNAIMSAFKTTGTRSIQNNVFDVPFATNGGFRDFTINNNYFNDGFYTSYSSAVWSNNFLRMTATLVTMQGQITTSYYLLDADMSNPHVNGTGGDYNSYFTGVMFGQSGVNAGDSGEFILSDGPTIITTFTVTNSIFLPSGNGYQTLEAGDLLGSSSDSNTWTKRQLNFQHNTWFGGHNNLDPGFAMLDYSETVNMAPGMIAAFKSNIVWNPELVGKIAKFCKIWDVGNAGSDQTTGYGIGPTQDVCLPANCDYNAGFNHSTIMVGGNAGHYTNQGKGYLGKFSVTPGVHDVDGQDPQFTNYHRNVEEFDAGYFRPYMGLAPATAWSSGGSYSIGNVVSHSTSTLYWGDTINYAYTNGSGCSSANPEPGAGAIASWENCWEFASLKDIRDGMTSQATFTDPSISAVSATTIQTMMLWIRQGYSPTNAAYKGSAFGGGDIGAVPATVGPSGPPVVTPSTPIAMVGGTVQLSSTYSVVYSMYPGSTGTVSAIGLYQAPIGFFTSKNAIAGVPLVPNDHIYNVDITSLPVDSLSASRIANIAGSVPMQIETAMPLNIFTNATPKTTMKFYYTTSSDGKQYPITPAPYTGVENALYPSDYFAQDRHQLGVNRENLQITEIYNKYPPPTGSIEGCPTCTAQSGIQYGPMSYQLANGDGSTDAAGMQILPLLIRYDELKAGAINHALRFTLSNGYNYTGFLWPGTNLSPQCGNLSTCFPYGSRLRLKKSFNISGFTPTAQVILTALKTYGMFMADNGQTMALQAQADVGSDTTTWTVINSELRFASHPDQTDFEMVDETSLMVSTASGRVNISNGRMVVPDNYAIVIASNTVDGTATYVYIAIQPVTVGTMNTPFPANSGTLVTMAGMPQFQIPYWVNGASVTTVNCTMTPTIGSLTSDCLYTAPASGITASSTTVVTITPTGAATSLGAISFPLTIMSSDAIRVDVGGKASSISSPVIPYVGPNYGPDFTGHLWAGDATGLIPPWYALDDNSSPQASWIVVGSTDVGLSYTDRHGASDGGWGAMVPNGNYTLTLRFATNDANGIALSSVTIDSQNLVILSTATKVMTTPYLTSVKTFPIQVTNNQFYFAIRQVYVSNFPQLTAWMLQFNSPLAQTSEQWRGKIHAQGRIQGVR